MPASGDQTRTVMVVAASLNGIAVAKPAPAPFVIVVPAHNSAAPDLITLATILVASVGSISIEEASAPPNPINPYSTPASSKVTGKSIWSSTIPSQASQLPQQMGSKTTSAAPTTNERFVNPKAVTVQGEPSTSDSCPAQAS